MNLRFWRSEPTPAPPPVTHDQIHAAFYESFAPQAAQLEAHFADQQQRAKLKPAEAPAPAQPAPETENHMGIFATILGYALALLPTIVTGIQTVVGDTQSGASKKQMAEDALAAALTGATSVLPTGSVNSTLAQGAAAAASEIIDASTAIASVVSHLHKTSAVSTAVNLTKATGAYQAATAANKAAAAPVAATA